MVAGALLLGTGLLLPRSRAFSGEIYLRLGAPEALVIRVSQGEGATDAGLRGLHSGELPFADPENAALLPPGKRFDAAVLPFYLRLDGAEALEIPAPRDTLRLESVAASAEQAIAPGSEVKAGNVALRVEALHPRVRLEEHPAGAPFGLLYLRRAGQLEPVFFEAGKWVTLAEGLGGRVDFYPDAGAARSGMQLPPPRFADARWGVDDGNATQWFEGVQVGSGVILEDGTAVTLLFQGERAMGRRSVPAIELGLEGPGGLRREWVLASQRKPDSPYHFEAPAANGCLLALGALPDGSAWAVAMQEGVALQGKVLQPGVWWRPAEDIPWELRFEGASRHALPVTAEQANDWEAELTRGRDSYRLREGISSEIEGVRVCYARTERPPRMQFTLARLDASGAAAATIHAATGERFKAGGWEFVCQPTQSKEGVGVILATRRLAGGRSTWIIGIAMGLPVLWLARRRGQARA